MTRKEKMDLLLTKVPESEKEAFIADLRQVKSREDILTLLEKYHIVLTEDEKTVLNDTVSNELTDEDLDLVAGGCWFCQCQHNGSCNCS